MKTFKTTGYLPPLEREFLPHKEAAIAAMLERGLPVEKVAIAAHVSRASVRRYIKTLHTTHAGTTDS